MLADPALFLQKQQGQSRESNTSIPAAHRRTPARGAPSQAEAMRIKTITDAASRTVSKGRVIRMKPSSPERPSNAPRHVYSAPRSSTLVQQRRRRGIRRLREWHSPNRYSSTDSSGRTETPRATLQPVPIRESSTHAASNNRASKTRATVSTTPRPRECPKRSRPIASD